MKKILMHTHKFVQSKQTGSICNKYSRTSFIPLLVYLPG